MSHPFEDLNPNQFAISHLQSHPAPENHLPEGLTMALASGSHRPMQLEDFQWPWFEMILGTGWPTRELWVSGFCLVGGGMGDPGYYTEVEAIKIWNVENMFFFWAWGSVIVGIDFTKSHCFAVGTPPIDKKTYCQRWQALHLSTGFPRKHCWSSSHCHFRRRVFSIAIVVSQTFFGLFTPWTGKNCPTWAYFP